MSDLKVDLVSGCRGVLCWSAGSLVAAMTTTIDVIAVMAIFLSSWAHGNWKSHRARVNGR